MPTIGQPNSFFGVFAGAGDLERMDFLRLDFVRESPARRVGVRFALMAAFYVNSGIRMTQASIAAGSGLV